MEFIRDLTQFIIQRKKYLLIPVITALTLAGLILLAAGNSYMAPFIYSLF
ncbi:hypothetical protein J2X69_000352 [Algoriphagus sp. 4150]|nr:DUF5989 family protein [Algoriphagus sp. 4150]MDR7128024.1 hypothetical protein [Algoriphagus sp. 4150]